MTANIDLISASAGSGKTYRLANEIIRAIDEGVAPECIVATTFTNKAAAELIRRIRTFLLENGKWQQAQQIIDGYVGTVNSVCGRLLKDFCFEAGLPPVLEVIPEENQSVVFERAVGPVIADYAGRIEPVAQKLGQEQWQMAVKMIIDKARTNNISAEELNAHAAWSFQGLKRVLPEPFDETKEKELDGNLYSAVKAAPGLIDPDDTTKKTKEFKTDINKILQRSSSAKELSWYDWVGLTKKSPGAKSKAAGALVGEAASAHRHHPRFHRDLKSYISLIFECAASAMQCFADVKKSGGWIDFVDQEALLLKLLESEKFSELLAERIERLFVDEFQDTSPIQMALFVKMANVVKATVWVGDQKQSIFGFRGTDPVYMDKVIAQLIDSHRLDNLGNNYRSHPDLVDFTNSVFVPAFSAQGFRPGSVGLEPRIEAGGSGMPHLGVWRFAADNKQDDTGALAASIKYLLENNEKYPVLDKAVKQKRPLQPSDLAVLCRTNKQCTDTADSLEALGIGASVPRTGLLDQAEVVLTMAALRYLVDPADTLARAEVVHLASHDSGTPRWFREVLNHSGKVLDNCPFISKLNENRHQMLHLSPVEAMHMAIEISQAAQMTLKWGQPDHRLANLDALVGLTRAYEDYCQSSKAAGTPAGLIRYLYSLADEKKDFQASGVDQKAVQVLTYHRAKGLEWPVVVLTELDSKNMASAFGICVENSDKEFDSLDPLAGRWIRYWPWPYGRFSAGFGWDTTLANCREHKSEKDKQARERLRLLYVGMTRARDYMFFSFRKNGRTQWLNELVDNNGDEIISIPDNGQNIIIAGGKTFDAPANVFEPQEPEEDNLQEETYRIIPPEVLPDHLPARFSPSASAIDGLETEIRIIPIGDSLSLSGGTEMDAFGNAVHRFLAADFCGFAPQSRQQAAMAILQSWGIESFSAESLTTASDRLKHFIESNFGKSCKCCPEWPVHIKMGSQKATGWIDLLIKTPDGHVIIDHKTYPGASDTIAQEVQKYAPQLAIYKEAVEKATRQAVKNCFLHLPVTGNMVEIKFQFSDGENYA